MKRREFIAVLLGFKACFALMVILGVSPNVAVSVALVECGITYAGLKHLKQD